MIYEVKSSCRCVNLQRTTGVMTDSWACVSASSLLRELRVEACAGTKQLLNCSSSARQVETWNWFGDMGMW